MVLPIRFVCFRVSVFAFRFMCRSNLIPFWHLSSTRLRHQGWHNWSFPAWLSFFNGYLPSPATLTFICLYSIAVIVWGATNIPQTSLCQTSTNRTLQQHNFNLNRTTILCIFLQMLLPFRKTLSRYCCLLLSSAQHFGMPRFVPISDTFADLRKVSVCVYLTYKRKERNKLNLTVHRSSGSAKSGRSAFDRNRFHRSVNRYTYVYVYISMYNQIKPTLNGFVTTNQQIVPPFWKISTRSVCMLAGFPSGGAHVPGFSVARSWMCSLPFPIRTASSHREFLRS